VDQRLGAAKTNHLDVNDFRVRSLRDQDKRRIAEDARARAGVASQTRFDIARIIRRLTTTEVPNKGTLKIVNLRRGSRFPYVSYKPSLRLFVQEETLDLASDGDPFSTYILAHELGHILLHDQDAKRFSPTNEAQLKSIPEEESAEWQAHRFAHYFLLPDKWVTTFETVERIVENCNVQREVAIKRVSEVGNSRMRECSQICANCHNFMTFHKAGFLCVVCKHR
jgi:hypothetical protein